MKYLLDTSVFSQPLRRKPVEAALWHWKERGDSACRVSIVTVAEVEWGLHFENRKQRWQRYTHLLQGRLECLNTDEDVWRQFAQMKARQRRLGLAVADLDLLIAATARIHHLTVATLNAGDFARIEGSSWEDWPG